MRMRKKPNLVPRMERCARFLIQAPEEQRGHWRELKPDAEQIWLELGCGKGRFTAETAAQNPNVLYLAVERVPDAMIVAMERCAQRSLTNVFLWMVTRPGCGSTSPRTRSTACLSTSATPGPPTATPGGG